MNLNCLNPHVRYVRVHKSAASRAEYSMNYDCRLFFFKKADGAFVIGDEKYKISNNCAVYLPHASRYKLEFPRGIEYEAIVFNFDLTQAYARITESLTTDTESRFDPLKLPVYDFPAEFAAPIVREITKGSELLWQCVDEFTVGRNLYRESVSALLKTFLIELLRENAAHGSSKLVSGIIDFLKESYGNPSLSNSDIADRFGYHPYYLSKLMKEATGRSLKQYLLYYRLQAAKDLLINSEASVDEVAWRSGFGTSAYFIKCFKESMGITPLCYRKSKRGLSL